MVTLRAAAQQALHVLTAEADWHNMMLMKRDAVAALRAAMPEFDGRITDEGLKTDEALLRQALEALEACLGWPHVIEAIKERLK
jgi:hypothetical protein